MTTPILKIPEVANGQVDQYLTINEGDREREGASDGLLTVDLAGLDAVITNLTPDFEMLRFQTFRAENNTVARSITFSANQRSFKVENAGTFELDVIIGSTTISVPIGDLYSFYADGTVDGLTIVNKPDLSLSGNKNLIINGNLNTTIINQRGFAGGQPAAGIYGKDRWKGDTLGTRIEQIVENTEVINGPYTISWVGGTGTADVDGVVGLSSGDTFTLSTSGNFSVIVPTDSTYVKLEKGDTKTPFEIRTVGEELALCQRYYQKSYSQDKDPAAITTAGCIAFKAHTTGHQEPVKFGVTMRGLPTVTLYDPSDGSTGGWRDQTAGVTRVATSAFVGTDRFRATLTATADGNSMRGHYTADAEL